MLLNDKVTKGVFRMIVKRNYINKEGQEKNVNFLEISVSGVGTGLIYIKNNNLINKINSMDLKDGDLINIYFDFSLYQGKLNPFISDIDLFQSKS